MASSHRVATLLQTWIFFFLIYPDRKRIAAGIQLSLNFVWAAEKSSGRKWTDEETDCSWLKCCLKFVCSRRLSRFLVCVFEEISLVLSKGIRPAAPNRTLTLLVVALLPCAVGISCCSGTPGDPKGATPGCWKISPWRPTSIRDLLAWSGIQDTQYPHNAKQKHSAESGDLLQTSQVTSPSSG